MSKQRPDKVCSACQKRAKHNSGFITRHHLLPRGIPGWHLNTDSKGRVKTVGLCLDCHILVHDTWGEGHLFQGPTRKKDLLRWIRLKKGLPIDLQRV